MQPQVKRLWTIRENGNHKYLQFATGRHKSAALCRQWRAVAAVVAAEEQNNDPANPDRLCDWHCCRHHHSHDGLGLCGGGGTQPHRCSRRVGGGHLPFCRSHCGPSNVGRMCTAAADAANAAAADDATTTAAATADANAAAVYNVEHSTVRVGAIR